MVDLKKQQILKVICTFTKCSNYILGSLFFLIFSCNSSQDSLKSNAAKHNKPDDIFSAHEFDQVVVYEFYGDNNFPLIDSSGKLTTAICKAVTLSNSQIDYIKYVLNDSTTFGGPVPIDFYPHFGIVFYRENKMIDFISISLLCNDLHTSFDLPQKNRKGPDEKGFSITGAKKILAFYKELGFTIYLDQLKKFNTYLFTP